MMKNSFHQSGVSLVSMMVGMTISMVVILGMLTVYKTTARVSAEAGQGASTDGQRLAALFAAQSLLQEAGFGIDAAALGVDLVVVNGSKMDDASKKLTGADVTTSSASGNAIIWGAKIDGKYICNGLYAPVTGGLSRLGAVACPGATAAASWELIEWAPVVLVQDDNADRAMTITVSSKSCQPFGIGGSGTWLVKLATKNSTSLPVTASACLSNF